MLTYEELIEALDLLAKNCNSHGVCDFCIFYDEEGETNCKLRNSEPGWYGELVDK